MTAIEIFRADRRQLLPLFRLADESESEILSYFRLGDVLVAHDAGTIVGIALVEMQGDTAQLISLAVAPSHQAQGIGSTLIAHAARLCRDRNASRLIVGTGAWEAANVAFYMKRGFRPFHIEPAFFSPRKGYATTGDQLLLSLCL